jgi:hypothetical protein
LRFAALGAREADIETIIDIRRQIQGVTKPPAIDNARLSHHASETAETISHEMNAFRLLSTRRLRCLLFEQFRSRSNALSQQCFESMDKVDFTINVKGKTIITPRILFLFALKGCSKTAIRRSIIRSEFRGSAQNSPLNRNDIIHDLSRTLSGCQICLITDWTSSTVHCD